MLYDACFMMHAIGILSFLLILCYTVWVLELTKNEFQGYTMSKIREISPEEWEQEEYKNYSAIDLRDEAEYELGHIENAEWRAISDLLRDNKTLDKSKAYLLYCKYGTISRELGERLSEEGYKIAN